MPVDEPRLRPPPQHLHIPNVYSQDPVQTQIPSPLTPVSLRARVKVLKSETQPPSLSSQSLPERFGLRPGGAAPATVPVPAPEPRGAAAASPVPRASDQDEPLRESPGEPGGAPAPPVPAPISASAGPSLPARSAFGAQNPRPQA